MIEELQNEINRISRKSQIKANLDATACYDRIIPGFASLASQKYGMHKNVCIVQATTLEEAKYHLRTQHSVTEEFYKHCKAFPIYGTGQGSGSSPVLWIIISSILIDAHQANSHGAQYSSPDHKTYITFSIVGFVDDSSSQVNDFSTNLQDNIAHLISNMQQDLQLWSDMLTFTGGSLNQQKCSYHITYYSFRESGNPI